MHRIVFALIALMTPAAQAQTDPRFIGEPARYADGTIKRSQYQRALFVQMYPCPATGETSGTCSGWQVDHVIPLACGGIDAPINMQWLPIAIKSCALSSGLPCKDRFERRVYRTSVPC